MEGRSRHSSIVVRMVVAMAAGLILATTGPAFRPRLDGVSVAAQGPPPTGQPPARTRGGFSCRAVGPDERPEYVQTLSEYQALLGKMHQEVEALYEPLVRRLVDIAGRVQPFLGEPTADADRLVQAVLAAHAAGSVSATDAAWFMVNARASNDPIGHYKLPTGLVDKALPLLEELARQRESVARCQAFHQERLAQERRATTAPRAAGGGGTATTAPVESGEWGFTGTCDREFLPVRPGAKVLPPDSSKATITLSYDTSAGKAWGRWGSQYIVLPLSGRGEGGGALRNCTGPADERQPGCIYPSRQNLEWSDATAMVSGDTLTVVAKADDHAIPHTKYLIDCRYTRVR